MEIKNVFFEKISTETDMIIASNMTEPTLVGIMKCPKIFTPVGNTAKKRALERLSKRIENGEDLYRILDIEATYSYYVNKIASGITPMSDMVYYRIMGTLPFSPSYFCHLHYQDPVVRKFLAMGTRTDVEKRKESKAHKQIDYYLGVKGLAASTMRTYRYKDNSENITKRRREYEFKQFVDLLEGRLILMKKDPNVSRLRAVYDSMTDLAFENSTRNLRFGRESLEHYLKKHGV